MTKITRAVVHADEKEKKTVTYYAGRKKVEKPNKRDVDTFYKNIGFSEKDVRKCNDFIVMNPIKKIRGYFIGRKVNREINRNYIKIGSKIAGSLGLDFDGDIVTFVTVQGIKSFYVNIKTGEYHEY